MTLHPHLPMIIDSFAGGGGASTGIELALGRSPDVAINHSQRRWRSMQQTIRRRCTSTAISGTSNR
ncbi:hypothetical protein QWZ10_11060 [Paracoccus cavernae]|uniref:DNA cytosine methyltransferase n=1 Tax=Paracoccus cavernae TaxID=1571207 RepID=A0ABT8D7D5_9RHOB|nr:hypothetical protein [Paracoccus cavernae]